MSKLFCIYHGNCDDGFGAAWTVRQALGDKSVEFYPGVYQQNPPDITGKHVLFVDFSYKKPVLIQMAKKARSIVILDHHKTAAEDLSGFREPAPFSMWHNHEFDDVVSSTEPITALFDMNRSGAGLAWDFFHNAPRPLFINYLEDRDLWRRQLPNSDEFTIALRSYPQKFEVWDQLSGQVQELINEGRAIQRYYRLRIEDFKRSAYLAEIKFGGKSQLCGVTNAPYFAASEAAGELCDYPGAAFGACFFEVSQGQWQYSLRSRGDFDVSEIALAFGGGGHKNAAGFTVEFPIHKPVQ